jgi:Tol biopolymer transport system component
VRSLPSVVVVFVAAGVAALTAVTWMLPASDAAAAWPGANGRLSFFTIRDAKVQLRTGPLDLRPSRRITWFPPKPIGLHLHSGYGQWSPSGRRLLFQRVTVGFEIRTARGRLVRRFPVDELWGPSWSPDGRRIVAADLHAGQRSLVVMNADGTGMRRVATGVAVGDGISHPRWSPAGGVLVYEEGTEQGPWVRRVAAAGGGDRRLAKGRLPTWSPDGARIAFARGPDVFTMRADGTGERRIAAAPAADRDNQVVGLTFSPDGSAVAFVRQDDVFRPSSCTLFTVPAEGGRQRARRFTTGLISAIDWQPR